MSGTIMSETAGWQQVQMIYIPEASEAEKIGHLRAIFIWSRSSFKNMNVYSAGPERNIM